MQTPSVPFRVDTVTHMRGGYAIVRANGVLRLEVNRVSALADVPWAEGPRCALTVRRADRGRLRELALDVDLRLADARLRELEAPE